MEEAAAINQSLLKLLAANNQQELFLLILIAIIPFDKQFIRIKLAFPLHSIGIGRNRLASAFSF